METVRGRLGSALFARVGGETGPADRARIHRAPGPRRFAEDSPICRVHGDAAMFVGGIRALLLQSLHPLAMAAVAAHSGYRGDPWGRLQRTARFIATTTFATLDDADHAIAVVRAVHDRIGGTAPDGRAYRAGDPHLLRWVHIAETDSFLRAHDRYGAHPLDRAGRDLYVAQTAVIGRALGASDVPESAAELADALRQYRPELAGTAQAREAARFLLFTPPVPLAMRAPYTTLAAAAVGLMPRWSRRPLHLPWLPLTEASVIRAGGIAATRGISWITRADPA